MNNNTIILHLSDDEVRALRDAVYVARYNSDSSSSNTLESLDDKLQLELGLLTPDFVADFSMETFATLQETGRSASMLSATSLHYGPTVCSHKCGASMAHMRKFTSITSFGQRGHVQNAHLEKLAHQRRNLRSWLHPFLSRNY